jgi:hypothetical protein
MYFNRNGVLLAASTSASSYLKARSNQMTVATRTVATMACRLKRQRGGIAVRTTYASIKE